MENKLIELCEQNGFYRVDKFCVNWQVVAKLMNEYLGENNSADAYRSRYRRYRESLEKGQSDRVVVKEPKPSNNYSNEVNKYTYTKGEHIYEDIIAIGDNEVITPESIMQKHHLDSREWIVVSFTTNIWQQQTKDGTKINLCQSKLTVKPKTDSELTFDDIDAYFENKDWNVKTKPISYEYKSDGEILEICYTDAHNGLLSWHEESGKDYDLKIAVERFRYCIEDIVDRCKTKIIKKILFITLGDIIHADNDQQTTTKGTLQQVDGRIAKIFNVAVDMMINSLDRLLEIAPVEYIYLSGNHDRVMGYCLAKSLQMAYRRDERVVFDISPNPQKYRLIGMDTYLIGLCHGDMSKKNLAEWLQRIIRTEIGIVKFASVHCGHLHSQSMYEKDGILIKHLPALCESSHWEHKEGYSSDKAFMCFVYDEKSGLRETWITNI